MLKLYIPAMTCSHCAQKVENAIKSVDVSSALEIDVPARTASIKSATGEAGLLVALSSAGYPAQKVM